jgi:hypothetical protein
MLSPIGLDPKIEAQGLLIGIGLNNRENTVVDDDIEIARSK